MESAVSAAIGGRMAIFSNWKFLGLFLLLPLVALVAFACSDDDDDDDGSNEADAVAALCADLTTLDTAGATFDGLTSANSVDDVKDANEAYSDALSNVIDSANDLADVRTGPIQDAYDALDSAIDDLSGADSIADGLAAIENELVAVDTAYDQLVSGVTCV